MSYLKELKVAVINEDIEKIKELINISPSYSSVEEAKEILAYINLAKELVQKRKNKLAKEMREIQKLKKFYEKETKKSFNLEA